MQVFWDKSVLPNEAGRANRAATWLPKSGSQSQSRQIEIDTFLCGALTFIATDRETAAGAPAAATPAAAGTAILTRAIQTIEDTVSEASIWYCKKNRFNQADFI